MKLTNSTRQLLYTGLILFCGIFTAIIFFNGKQKSSFPELKPRTATLAQASDWAETQKTYRELVKALETNPKDTRSKLQLAKTLMGEGRVTGDLGYYNVAALSLIQEVLDAEPGQFEAICLKSMALLSQHRFAEGKAIAEQALKVNPYNSFVYGLLVDANVEMGQYDTAVIMADNMVRVRPDIRSYSRVSYLRELHGFIPEAIEAIQQAVAAGAPGREDTEWARMVLAHLYEDNNQPELAKETYEISLQYRPDYPFALAGLGRIARFKKDYPAAIAYYEKACQGMSDIGFFQELAEVYRLGGQSDKAEKCLTAVLNALLADRDASKTDGKGWSHNSDLELAQVYLAFGQADKALEFARAEYNRRPANLDAAETYAWSLLLAGQKTEALNLVPALLRTNSLKPERLVKAGIILCENNRNEEGKKWINQGVSMKPYLNEELAARAGQLIK